MVVVYVSIPDEFRAEFSARDTTLQELASIAASASLPQTSEEGFIQFLQEKGWSNEFAQWLLLTGLEYGYDLKLVLPLEPIHVTEKRDYEEWAKVKRQLIIRGVTLLLVAGLAQLGIGMFAVVSAFVLVLMPVAWIMALSGAICILRAKGREDWEYFLYGDWILLLRDKNKRPVPRGPKREKGSSALSDW